MNAEAMTLCRGLDAELDQFKARGAESRLGQFFAVMGTTDAVVTQYNTPAGLVLVVSSARAPGEGLAAVRYADGSAYIGELSAGLREGAGVRTYTGGVPLLFQGLYHKGKKHGPGRLIELGSGTVVYDGHWVNDIKQGEGVLFHDGATYRGAFVDGMFHGRGKISWHNGDVYEGDFVRGQRSGEGLMKFARGDAYEGGFVDGLFHGNGAYRWASGEVFVGEFQQGRLRGPGAVQYPMEVYTALSQSGSEASPARSVATPRH